MATYGIHFLAGSRRMTPKQFANSIAGAIGGYTSNVELEIQMQRDKAAIRSLFQIAAIIFQRIISRTPMDEDYSYEVVNDKGEEITRNHQADDSVVRYDWTMMVHGETVKIFSCRDFVAKDPNFGMTFNNRKDINLILDELLKSNLKPQYITTSKGEIVPDFQISFDNPNPHFRTIEFGMYKKESTGVKEGKNYPHGVNEDHFTYQAPKGFYAITMKEYEAFIATHEADRWRTLSQKMLRQKVEKTFSDKKFNQILKVVNASTPSEAFNKVMQDEMNKKKPEAQKKMNEELKKEKVEVPQEDIGKWVFYESDTASYWQNEFHTTDYEEFKKKLKGSGMSSEFKEDIKRAKNTKK